MTALSAIAPLDNNPNNNDNDNDNDNDNNDNNDNIFVSDYLVLSKHVKYPAL
jgi:hypothetical protein